MTWEYKVIYASANFVPLEELNEAGKENWELVAVFSGEYILKRRSIQ